MQYVFRGHALRLAAAVTIAAGLVAAGEEPRAAGVPNFHQVDPHIYRGGQPSERGLESLSKLGIKTVVDLREGGSHTAAERRAVEALGMMYVSIPMNGFRAPSDQQVARVLALFDTPGSAGWPVFVHCRRGADRTGTVVACYRIAHGRWDNNKALTEAKLHGMSRLERGMQAYILGYRSTAETQLEHPTGTN